MKKPIKKLVLLVLTICFLSSCSLIYEKQKQDYGLLKSAVMFSSEKVIGEYGEQIPVTFDSNQFVALVRDKIPEDYLRALENYKLEVEPHGWYYLLKAYDREAVVLFDYSCTTEIDGPVLDLQETFDLTNLDMYDNCK